MNVIRRCGSAQDVRRNGRNGGERYESKRYDFKQVEVFTEVMREFSESQEG